jgi:hypothetical protein
MPRWRTARILGKPARIQNRGRRLSGPPQPGKAVGACQPPLSMPGVRSANLITIAIHDQGVVDRED